MGKLMCIIKARILLCWSDFEASRVCLNSVASARKVQGDICGCFAKVKGRVLAVESSKRSELVGGLEHFLFFHILGLIIPTDSYFSEGFSQPPTSWACSKLPQILSKDGHCRHFPEKNFWHMRDFMTNFNSIDIPLQDNMINNHLRYHPVIKQVEHHTFLDDLSNAHWESISHCQPWKRPFDLPARKTGGPMLRDMCWFNLAKNLAGCSREASWHLYLK